MIIRRLVLVDIDCSPTKIASFGSLRSTVKYLEAHKCGLSSIGSILLCDADNFCEDTIIDVSSVDKIPSKFGWNNLEYLDLRENEIVKIDGMIKLAPKLGTLLLGCNKIQAVDFLTDLPDLRTLEVS